MSVLISTRNDVDIIKCAKFSAQLQENQAVSS